MTSFKRWSKDAAKAGLAFLHRTSLRTGMMVLPNHYYSPVADQRELARNRANWAKRAPLHGIDMDLTRQIAALEAQVAPHEPEYRGNARFKEGVAQGYGPGYGYVEAQCLHGVLRTLKPKRIIEVGSGVSTHIMRGAIERNAAEGSPGKITCIEPYPSAFLKSAEGIELVVAPVQNMDPSFFDTLEAGDFLFIDSTHAAKPGGDVNYLYLSVIPRLKPGVVVHVHDIYLPYIYQRDVLTTLFQWGETALLAALLTDNARLSVEFCLSHLHYDASETLKRVFPEYNRQEDVDGLRDAPDPERHFPSSIYLKTR